MKRKYLLAFVLAGVLTVVSAPITASAASPNAGGTIVGQQQADAGDELEIGDDDTPLGAPEDETPEDVPDDGTPESTPDDGTPEESQGDVQLDDDETPLAVLSTDTKATSPVGTVLIVVGCVAGVAVVGTGIAVATGAIGAGAAAAGTAGSAGAAGAKSGLSWLKGLFKKRK